MKLLQFILLGFVLFFAFTLAFDCGEAYRNGKSIGNKECTYINGKPVTIETAEKYYPMQQAAAQEGITLKIKSGFRTMKEQKYLYQCYKTKQCNRGNKAAKPGTSNHQNGIALDIDTNSSRVYKWLTRNASKYGWVRTVASETWHFEYRGEGTPCNAFVKYSCK